MRKIIIACILIHIVTFALCNNPDEILIDLGNDVVELDFSNHFNGYATTSGRDEVIGEITIPDEMSGIVATDLCFVPDVNKFYVYGDTKITVYNGNTLEKLSSIEISDKCLLSTPIHTFGKTRKICYIPGYDLIACHSNDKKIKIIDPNSNSIVSEISFPNFLDPTYLSYTSFYLSYSSRDNRLYAFYRYSDNDEQSFTCILSYDIDLNGNLSLNYSQNLTGHDYIMDVVFNPYRDRIYVSFYFGEVKILNSLNGSEVNSIAIEGQSGPLSFVDKYPSTSKIYCTKNGGVLNQLTVIDADNDFSSSTINVPYHNFYSIFHSAENNKIYLGYSNSGLTGILILDDESGNQTGNIYTSYNNTAKIRDITINPSNNYLFAAHGYGIKVINLNTNQIINNFVSNQSYHIRLERNTINNNVFSVAVWDRMITGLNGNGDLLIPPDDNVGSTAYNGINCPGVNKIYFYTTSYRTRTDVLAYDTITDEIICIDGISETTGCAFNEESNRVYVSTHDENKIYAIDAITGQILENESIIFNLTADKCEGLYLSPNEKLYCVLNSEKIAIVDFSQTPYSITYIPVTNLSNLLRPRFTYNNTTNEVWIGVNDMVLGSSDSDFYIFDDMSSQYEHRIIQNQGSHILKMKHLSIGENYVVYAKTGAYGVPIVLKKIDHNDNIINISLDYTPIDIENSNEGCLYVSTDEAKIARINAETNNVEYVDMPSQAVQIKYNPLNDKLYTFTINPSNNYSFEIASFECTSDQVYSYPLNYHLYINNSSMSIPITEIAFSPELNRIYCHPGDNAIKVLQCNNYETKTFSSGWQWLSFPRLTEQGTSNGEIFEQAYWNLITQTPGLLQETSGGSPTINDFDIMEGNRIPNAYISYNQYLGFNDQGFDNMLFRHEGYKVKVTDGADPTVLIVDGDRLGSYVIEDMPALEIYWLGYYIPYPQNIEDAFGYFFGDVNRVWAEDWFYDAHKIQRGGDPTQLASNSTIGKTMEYGKMYIVQMYYNVDNFSWNGSSTAEEPRERVIPESFTYTEKADYEVIDIVNITSNVTEIGVFEEDECVGAVVVEDSCAQILVYSDNANRDPIPFTFEIVIGRGLSIPFKDYLVLNHMTGEFEPSVIISGRQVYSAIKFGDQEEPENIISRPILNGNYPNPFNPTTTISFSLPSEQKIELTIYNIKVQKVKTLYSGTADEGEHTVIWEGKDTNNKLVSSGIYFYKLKTNNKELTRKMLMMK